ncbi:nucleotidyltransferase family protein [Neobacillus rhizophilus]|uniref:Nucleotidyltransferase family protein n=1 Tax=Neobacillus rhizophilus TaxID=2833579 RepID=A0A942U360_9BACI|nr:nucleotidyltransferase family protein [Neobacillus rhizophilus]MBS4213775.1 nucleotidyltransferase family protein [Neobacillus rhizophilus]MBU8917819.1 nucleotidyltransferase family protein [Bacillus sp. FJAT-29953]
MMEILKIAKTMNLPDWWICAGFVRSKIWDVLHGFTTRTPLQDIDVIYFNPENIDEYDEKKREEKLKILRPDIPWSIKNQARMHVINKLAPYSSAVDGISKFPETATAVGVKLDEKDNLVISSPWGIEDLIHMEVKPTPLFLANMELNKVYFNRVKTKKWEETWNQLKIST